MKLSVIVPTHNPRLDYLERVLAGLRGQTLPMDQWELVVIDNRSERPLAASVDLGWHRSGRHLREERLGLTPTRLAGFANTSAEVIVMVDDDNVLAPDYLEKCLEVAA